MVFAKHVYLHMRFYILIKFLYNIADFFDFVRKNKDQKNRILKDRVLFFYPC